MKKGKFVLILMLMFFVIFSGSMVSGKTTKFSPASSPIDYVANYGKGKKIHYHKTGSMVSGKKTKFLFELNPVCYQLKFGKGKSIMVSILVEP
jgi:hypothetical protein